MRKARKDGLEEENRSSTLMRVGELNYSMGWQDHFTPCLSTTLSSLRAIRYILRIIILTLSMICTMTFRSLNANT